jgi:hypothetical protein
MSKGKEQKVGGSSPTSWPPGSLDPAKVASERIVATHPDGSVAETKPTAEEIVEAASVCSVCGQGENLTGSAGVARWHAACEAARPDVIAKVRARA